MKYFNLRYWLRAARGTLLWVGVACGVVAAGFGSEAFYDINDSPPAPLVFNIYKPDMVRLVSLTVAHQPVNEQVMMIQPQTVTYDALVSGKEYSAFRHGVIWYNNNHHSLWYWLRDDEGYWIKSERTFPMFASTAFYRSAYPERGTLIFEPERDWLFIGFLLFVAICFAFACVGLLGIAHEQAKVDDEIIRSGGVLG